MKKPLLFLFLIILICSGCSRSSPVDLLFDVQQNIISCLDIELGKSTREEVIAILTSSPHINSSEVKNSWINSSGRLKNEQILIFQSVNGLEDFSGSVIFDESDIALAVSLNLKNEKVGDVFRLIRSEPEYVLLVDYHFENFGVTIQFTNENIGYSISTLQKIKIEEGRGDIRSNLEVHTLMIFDTHKADLIRPYFSIIEEEKLENEKQVWNGFGAYEIISINQD